MIKIPNAKNESNPGMCGGGGASSSWSPLLTKYCLVWPVHATAGPRFHRFFQSTNVHVQAHSTMLDV